MIAAPYCFSRDVKYFHENGVVENWQLAYLGIAVVLYIFMGKNVTGLDRLKFFGLAIFLFTGFVRETDPRATFLEPYIGGFYHHHYQSVIVGLFWLSWFLSACRNFFRIIEYMLKWSFTLPGILSWIGIGLFAVGAVFERYPSWWGQNVSKI